MPSKPLDPRIRISRKVRIDADTFCWEWAGTKDRVGYGRLKIQLGARDKFRFTSAHRYAYEIFVGHIPPGLNVLHRCDNRQCCNPEHLFLGTQQDNIRDMHTKGRGPRGYTRNRVTCANNARQRGDAAIAKERQS